MTKEQLRAKANSLPLKPGVYIMMDKSGGVIYVGKAKALHNRVTQYFQGGGGHSAKTAAMVAQVHEFDTIVADSEFEALILECSLIKRHQPKYNILLKDGKGYPFIRVSNEEYPRFSLSARRGEDARYFGPYGGRSVAFGVIRALSEALGLPSCERRFPRDIGKERPCLQYHLKRCAAPCNGGVSPQAFGELIEQAVLLMEGKQAKLVSELEVRMLAAADELLFEKAAALRDRRDAVSQLSRRQKVISAGMADMDVVGYHAGDAKSCVAVLHFLGGELYSRDVHMFPLDYEEPQVLSEFLKQYYGTRRQLPRRVLISCDIEDGEAVERFLREQADHAVTLHAPKRGEDAARVKLASGNAREELERQTTKEERVRKLMTELTRMLGLEKTVRRIEAYDISNTGDSNRVGAMTVHVDGEPLKRGYRLFAIKDESIRDDFHAMQEVLTRRFKRLKEGDEKFTDMPDALFIDGGAVHAAMVVRALETLGLPEVSAIPVYGMVKDDRHRTRALVTPDGAEIGIGKIPKLFAFVGRIQEETHRFAITYHRKKSGKTNLKSELDGIAGLGAKRAAKLREHFKTIKAVKAADVEALTQVLPQKVAEAVYNKFHKEKTDEGNNGNGKGTQA
ncbi:UvrABC system protein C [Clostridia bacterium]|nr:UvrABC system protein C [Clostridia bacterium]